MPGLRLASSGAIVAIRGYGSKCKTRIANDHAPSDEGDELFGRGLQDYIIGLVLAAALTVASFLAAQTHLIYGPGIPVALVALAIAQMGIHLVFFLHITTAPDNTNNVMALAFGILIVFLVVLGSIWIMVHLYGNLMPPMDHHVQISDRVKPA